MPWSAEGSLPDAVQDTGCLLYCHSTLLAHIKPAVPQNSQVLCSRAIPQPVSPQPFLLLKIIPFQVQDFIFIFVKPHAILVGPIFQPVKVSLNGGYFFPHTYLSFHFEIIFKLSEGSVLPLEHLQRYWTVLPDPALTLKELHLWPADSLTLSHDITSPFDLGRWATFHSLYVQAVSY